MSRFKLPFNDSVEIIWNEDGRYGAAYDDDSEDTFDGKDALEKVAVGTLCVAGTAVAATTILPTALLISPLGILAAIED